MSCFDADSGKPADSMWRRNNKDAAKTERNISVLPADSNKTSSNQSI